MQRNEIRKKILSNENINRIALSGYWVTGNHGSQIIDYFEDNELEYEYADSTLRKKVIKKYLSENIDSVLDDLEYLDGIDIYRTIYIKELPDSHEAALGRFWSTRPDTNPCIDNKLTESLEVTFKTKAKRELIDYFETALSRLDYVFGSREKEIQINDVSVRFSIYNVS